MGSEECQLVFRFKIMKRIHAPLPGGFLCWLCKTPERVLVTACQAIRAVRQRTGVRRRRACWQQRVPPPSPALTAEDSTACLRFPSTSVAASLASRCSLFQQRAQRQQPFAHRCRADAFVCHFPFSATAPCALPCAFVPSLVLDPPHQTTDHGQARRHQRSVCVCVCVCMNVYV